VRDRGEALHARGAAGDDDLERLELVARGIERGRRRRRQRRVRTNLGERIGDADARRAGGGVEMIERGGVAADEKRKNEPASVHAEPPFGPAHGKPRATPRRHQSARLHADAVARRCQL